MDMTIAGLSGIILFLITVGGLGWKLNAELSNIKMMLQVFITKTEGKFEEVIRIEKRVEKLEEKLIEWEKHRCPEKTH